MGSTLNTIFLVTVAIAALFQISLAQRDYVVGDALGWVIPPGPSVYATWAANKTFTAGDALVFNFLNGSHDVAKVTKANFDSCNGGNALLLLTNSPANVTLNETGSHYFICGFSGHCGAGQKLAVNVSAAGSSPAPQPSAAPPRGSSPAPLPSSPSPAPVSGPTRSPTTYTVGDNLGWTVPTSGASMYQTWANGKNFMVGDILVFNYVTGTHDVAEVTRAAYQPCNTSNLLSNFTTGPTRITLQTAGEHFYICAVPGHCAAGQKLAINVTGSSTATPPSSSSPSPSPSPSPSTATPPSSSSPSPSTATPPSSTATPTNPSTPSPAGDNNNTPSTPGNSATFLSVAGLTATLPCLIVAFLV